MADGRRKQNKNLFAEEGKVKLGSQLNAKNIISRMLIYYTRKGIGGNGIRGYWLLARGESIHSVPLEHSDCQSRPGL